LESTRLHDQIFPRGGHLLHAGESGSAFFTIKSGWVMLYSLLADGRRQIHEFALPGSFVGYEADGKQPLSYSAEALTDVTACVLPREGTTRLMLKFPEFAMNFACTAWHAQAHAFQHQSSLGRRNARERIAHLLNDLHTRALANGLKEPLALPITQEHIGDALGLTPVHVSRTLKGLRDEGIVSTAGHVLEVLDAGRLAEAAVVR
jgi:CRP-like cAMP-binding protein